MRETCFLLVLAPALLAASPGAAGAGPLVLDGETRSISVFDLAEGGGLDVSVEGTRDGVGLVAGNPSAPGVECSLGRTGDESWRAEVGDRQALAVAGAGSSEFHVVALSGEGDAEVLGGFRVQGASPIAGPLALDEAEGGVAVPAGLAGQEAVLQVPRWGWLALGQVGDGGLVDLDVKVEGLGKLVPLLGEVLQEGGAFAPRTRDVGGQESSGTVEGQGSGGTVATPGASRPSGRPPGVKTVDQQEKDWPERLDCPTHDDRRGRGPYVICLDLSGDSAGGPWETRLPTDDFILRPNRAFIIYVRHLASEDVEIGMTGKRGLYYAGDLDLTGDLSAENRGGDPPARTLITPQHFGPQLPGETRLAIRHGGHETILEFAIQPVYIGAIRVGLGMVFGTPEREYTIVTVPGSQTREVALATTEPSSPVAAEIVLGFAPFVFQPHGRAYFGPRGLDQRIAPYVGLGILQTRAEQDAARLSLLRSIYLGVEIEMTATSSLAAAFVLGRVDRLKQPYRVGGPVEDGILEVPTTPGFLPGAGVVINFSPDFLRLSPFSAGSKP